MSEVCDYCGAIIPNEVIARRVHRATHTCNTECETNRRKREGLFKIMSLVGKDARSQAVTKSNSEHPRRKKK